MYIFWYITGTAPDGAYNATNVIMQNSILESVDAYEDAIIPQAGLTMDSNHFRSGDSAGTNVTVGATLYVNATASNYYIRSDSAAYKSGAYIRAVPADIDGVLYGGYYLLVYV